MQTAKVFTSGRSQAVRIPKEYRFDESEIFINRVGDALVLTPVSKIQSVYQNGLDSFSADFMVDGRPDQIPTNREEL
ncbi:MAG: AbrB/MazE/SpoVT family DNA-binding domain-containing protein [Bacteroidales bacterium]|nr:AbrB/MazE/SpoVT family DNA-binding domain-containing protein [Bacteroidales bacterium]